MNIFNTNVLTLLSGFIFLNKIDDLKNIQILEVHDASIHNAGFDDACIHDSTNYAYIIDAYIYDEGGVS